MSSTVGHSIRIVALIVAATAAAAWAQEPSAKSGSDATEQLLVCANRLPDSARLACYDGLAASLSSSAPADTTLADAEVSDSANADDATEASTRPEVDPTTGMPVARTNQAPAPRNTETFDLDVQQKQSIRVMIEKTRRNARGDWYFYFDNDEVWKQIDTRNRRIPPLPVAATVSRGIFSSHKLHIDGEVWAMKIRRVK